MKEILGTIIETFEIIPGEFFYNRQKSDKSIYINMDKSGYELASEGKTFKTKAEVEIKMYEIRSSEIRPTKTETINYLRDKFKRQEDIIKQFALLRKQRN